MQYEKIVNLQGAMITTPTGQKRCNTNSILNEGQMLPTYGGFALAPAPLQDTPRTTIKQTYNMVNNTVLPPSGYASFVTNNVIVQYVGSISTKPAGNQQFFYTLSAGWWQSIEGGAEIPLTGVTVCGFETVNLIDIVWSNLKVIKAYQYNNSNRKITKLFELPVMDNPQNYAYDFYFFINQAGISIGYTAYSSVTSVTGNVVLSTYKPAVSADQQPSIPTKTNLAALVVGDSFLAQPMYGCATYSASPYWCLKTRKVASQYTTDFKFFQSSDYYATTSVFDFSYPYWSAPNTYNKSGRPYIDKVQSTAYLSYTGFNIFPNTNVSANSSFSASCSVYKVTTVSGQQYSLVGNSKISNLITSSHNAGVMFPMLQRTSFNQLIVSARSETLVYLP